MEGCIDNKDIQSDSRNVEAQLIPIASEKWEEHDRFDSIKLTTDDLYRIKRNADGTAHELTIIMLGGSRSGKTSVVRRFVMDVFSPKYKRSVGWKKYQRHCIMPIELHERSLADTNVDVMSREASPNPAPSSEQTYLWNHFDWSDDDIDTMDKSPSDTCEMTSEISGIDSDVNDNDKPITTTTTTTRTTTTTTTTTTTATKQRLSNAKTQLRITQMDLDITLNIIDLGFHAIADDTFFEKVNALVLVCDVTDASSLDHLLFKYQDFLSKVPLLRKHRASSVSSDTLRHCADPSPFIPVIVAANKCDLKSKRVISHQHIRTFVQTKIQPILDAHCSIHQNCNNSTRHQHTHQHSHSHPHSHSLRQPHQHSHQYPHPHQSQHPYQPQHSYHRQLREDADFGEYDEQLSIDTNSGTNTPKPNIMSTPITPYRSSDIDYHSNDNSARGAAKMKLMSPSPALGNDSPVSVFSRRQCHDTTVWSPPSVGMLCVDQDATWSDDECHDATPSISATNINPNHLDSVIKAKLIGDPSHKELKTAKRLKDILFHSLEPQEDTGNNGRDQEQPCPEDDDENANIDARTDSGSEDKLVDQDLNSDPAHITIVECSAANGKNVSKIFEKCIHKVRG
ncbi:hypothetical protein RFI_13600 [Reticulomyxa filosa]|uniref:Uncharacterized protein n=1 Tax=Reticulomyxa filosa TaxID=46433 RepID=X6NCF1_RETFI|nr:hypothetical protein RFI_13600 [Reticulomyxa filosa]|eukprot:ETO23578.1 hypothetical protein RFI_13600 [Reticulomyxa filosa]